MKTFIRADFDFKSEKDKIKHCAGYVICKDVQLDQNGSYTFSVHSLIVKKLIAKNPNFEIIERLAVQNCKLFDDEVIKVGSLVEHHD